MLLRADKVLDRLRESLWVIPTLAVVVSVGLALGLAAIDRRLDIDNVVSFGGGPDSARIVLSTIAGSMITFTGLVFSVTMLVLQQASSQFSPRVLRTYLRDRVSQTTLAVFIATFTYTLVVLREVRSGDDPFVPSLAVQFTFVLVLASLGMFVAFVHHIADGIRVETIIRRIAEETTQVIDRMYPADGTKEAAVSDGETPSTTFISVLSSQKPGVVAGLDINAMCAAASRDDCLVRVVPSIGGFVPSGATLVAVVGGTPGPCVADEALRPLVRVDKERTMRQDPAFGFRQLVDIALRALSPGVNDPTTAVSALDALHDLLRRLSGRHFPSGRTADQEGRLRLLWTSPTWDDYVGLAVDEILVAGKDSLQIQRKLRDMFEDLRSTALPPRTGAVERRLAEL